MGDIVAASEQEAVQSEPARDARDEAGSEGCAVARDSGASQDGGLGVEPGAAMGDIVHGEMGVLGPTLFAPRVEKRLHELVALIQSRVRGQQIR